jgi:hypothetical protein
MSLILNASTSSGLVVTADNSGSFVFQSNGANPVTLPNTGTGTVAVQGVSTNIVSGTAQSPTSGTSYTFTGIPSWAKRVTFMLNALAFNTSNIPQLQLGSGSVTSTGYVNNVVWVTNASAVNESGSTTGHTLVPTAIAGTYYGSVVFNLLGSNTWIGTGVTQFQSSGGTSYHTSSIALSGALDRINLTTTGGTATLSSGSINILYE